MRREVHGPVAAREQSLGVLEVGRGVDVQADPAGIAETLELPRANDSRAERRYDLLQRCLALELLAQSLEQPGVIAAEQRVQSVTVVNDDQRRVERSQPGEQRGRHERHVARTDDEGPTLAFSQRGDNPAKRVKRARRLAQYAAVEIGKRRVGLCYHQRLEAGGSSMRPRRVSA